MNEFGRLGGAEHVQEHSVHDGVCVEGPQAVCDLSAHLSDPDGRDSPRGYRLPKFIIDELTGAQSVPNIVGWILLLVFINLVGSVLSAYLKRKCFILKSEVFTEFQTMMAEKLSSCDFERLEDPGFRMSGPRPGDFCSRTARDSRRCWTRPSTWWASC